MAEMWEFVVVHSDSDFEASVQTRIAQPLTKTKGDSKRTTSTSRFRTQPNSSQTQFLTAGDEPPARSSKERGQVDLRALFRQKIPVRKHYAALPDGVENRRQIRLFPPSTLTPEDDRTPLRFTENGTSHVVQFQVRNASTTTQQYALGPDGTSGRERVVLYKPVAPPPTFTRASWPANVISLRDNFNPWSVRFQSVSPFSFCTCQEPCTQAGCDNASAGVFCAANCCVFKGQCGNSLRGIETLRLVEDRTRNYFAVVATADIQRGIIIGEYLGELLLVEGDTDVTQMNPGYRLLMKEQPKNFSGASVYIDAHTMGGLMRFVNHSCDPVARFVEVVNGSYRTVGVVTTRDVAAGEEITVHYGPDLWFICRCGHPKCCHRDIQHLSDPDPW